MKKSEEIILKAEGITKYFPGVTALDKVQLTLRKGEVLALVGENGAGKSTLMKILLGEYKADEGTMMLKNEPYNPQSPMQALSKGLSMMHQEICLVPTMTVAENIWTGREQNFRKNGFVSRKKMEQAAEEILQKMDVDIPVSAEVSFLSVANMQLVEIARAISYNSDVIIMDEPTSALTDEETKKLFSIIRELTRQGKSIIFISHKLDEIFEICDTITVFRDGKYINTVDGDKVTKEDLVGMMVGRKVENLYPKIDVTPQEKVLEVKNLTKDGKFRNVSFSVRKGEILGFVGLIGAGRTEVMEAVFGVSPADEGEIWINGKKKEIHSAKTAIDNHIAMVTEDRLRTGVFHEQSIWQNLLLPSYEKIRKKLFIYRKDEKEFTGNIMEQMSLKAASMNQEAGQLSGGNQQKVIIGRWMLTDPDIFILDEPTRGIDVGAKSEIYRIISEMAQSGKAIIVVSSELPEIMGICDRAIVMCEGQITGEFERKDFVQEKIMEKAFGIV